MPDPRTVLAEIQARADAADPAPWRRAVPDSLFVMAPDDEFGTYMLRTIPRTWNGNPSDEAVALAARNVEFICAARDDVPRLVALLVSILDCIDILEATSTEFDDDAIAIGIRMAASDIRDRFATLTEAANA